MDELKQTIRAAIDAALDGDRQALLISRWLIAHFDALQCRPDAQPARSSLDSPVIDVHHGTARRVGRGGRRRSFPLDGGARLELR